MTSSNHDHAVRGGETASAGHEGHATQVSVAAALDENMSHAGHPAATAQAETDAHGGHEQPEGHGGHGKHAGHHVELFRLRFWWSLLLSIPVVATSHMVMDWFGYELDFVGIEWVGPVLG